MYEIYTDGATSKNGREGAIGGYAWALIKDGECVDYYAHSLAPATNNICEMMAIIDSCEKISKVLEPFDKVNVYSEQYTKINTTYTSLDKHWLTETFINE